MALTAGKLIFYGPFTFDIQLTPTTSKYTRSALKGDSLTFNIETKKGNVVFEDGTESDWEEGRKLTMELLLSELDPASTTGDMEMVEAGDRIIITMLNGTVATVTSGMRFLVDADNGKTKITGWKAVAIGLNMSDIVLITTP